MDFNNLEALTAGLAALNNKSKPITLALDEPGGTARLDLVGVVGWDIDRFEVKESLDAMGEVESIEVHLDSPGGDYYAGIAIANQLRQHPAPVHVHVDALAASAGSVIAMGGDTITMHPGAMFMIHNARQTLLSATAEEMRQRATVLEEANIDMADIYMAKAGGTREEWLAAMAQEVWYRGESALDAGLVDEVVTGLAAKADPGKVAGWDMAALLALGHRGPTAEELDQPDWIATAPTVDLTGDADPKDEPLISGDEKGTPPGDSTDDDVAAAQLAARFTGAFTPQPKAIDLDAFASAVLNPGKATDAVST